MSKMNDFICVNHGVVGGMNRFIRMNHASMNEVNALMSEMNGIISVNHGVVSDMNSSLSMNHAWMNEMNPRTSEMNAFIKVNHALPSEMIAFISEMNECIPGWSLARQMNARTSSDASRVASYRTYLEARVQNPGAHARVVIEGSK